MGYARLLLAIGVAVTALAGALACGDGSGTPDDPASTAVRATSAPTATSSATRPPSGAPSEGGAAPIFWRTADNFTSVVVDVAYLVVFRIESGYNEPSLSVTAACAACAVRQRAFVGTNSTPVGEDSPGAYYPMNLTFPEAGTWQITVHAGGDEVVIPIEVRPSA